MHISGYSFTYFYGYQNPYAPKRYTSIILEREVILNALTTSLGVEKS